MKNHHDKRRDLSRSALIAVRDVEARKARTTIHRRVRADIRDQLQLLRRFADLDDYEGDLTRDAQPAITDVVAWRRVFDNLGALLAWTERTLAKNPALDAAPPFEQAEHFRQLLPNDLAGRHAADHIEYFLTYLAGSRAINEQARGGDNTSPPVTNGAS